MDIDSKVDRLSILPKKILHRVLFRYGLKSAAKSCVLSKAWRYVWCTNPTLLFHEDDLSLSVLDKILQTYHDRNLRLEEFALCVMNSKYDPSPLLNKWIPILIHDMGVKGLHISSFNWGRESVPPQLPSLIYESPNNIQDLFLEGCMFDDQVLSVDLKHLQTLFLDHVYIPEPILDHVLSNCPGLVDVTLASCQGFARIKLFMDEKRTSLARFFFEGSRNRDVSVEIGDHIQTLETIRIQDCLLISVSPDKPLEFPRLTRLILERVKLVSSELFSCNLHSLEELKLDQCSGIKEFKLSSRSMKHLDIHNISRPFKATVDAPSIVSFHYEGILPQSISFSTTNYSDDYLWKSEISLESSTYDYSFNELYGLLKALSQSEISLALDEIEIRRFQSQLPTNIDDIVGSVSEETKHHELPVAVEHLMIMRSERNVNSNASADFLNMLFRMFRPRFVCMGMDMLINSNDQFREIAELLFRERGTVQTDFWQHVLEVVSLKVLHHPKQSQWQPVKHTSLTELCKKEWLPVEHTSFTELCKKAADSRELEIDFHLKWSD